jgi:hypothetical protein
MTSHCLEIRALNEECSSFSVELVDSKEEIVVSAQDKLVQTSFSELSVLYFTSIKMSSESVIGNLISSEEDCGHFCGSIIPLPVLSLLVDRALKSESVKMFLQVAACLCKLVVQERPFTSQSIISSGKNAMRNSIEVSMILLSKTLIEI